MHESRDEGVVSKDVERPGMLTEKPSFPWEVSGFMKFVHQFQGEGVILVIQASHTETTIVFALIETLPRDEALRPVAFLLARLEKSKPSSVQSSNHHF
jgi:hypothetical protein